MTSTQPLKDIRILVAEDEFLLADDLARSLREVGAIVIGPAPTVAKAQCLLDEASGVDLAMLDVNLRDSFIYPVAESLKQRATPFLFTTGYDQASFPEAYRDVPKVHKPYDMAEVLDRLAKLLP